MKLAPDKAGICPEDIGISSTHGTGSAEEDAVECEQLSSVSILAPI
jgi:3-oxoacyl-(acyl-carrier-protein) synthase